MSSGAIPSQVAEAHAGVVSSSQIDYHQDAYSHPSYRYQTQFPSTFGQTIALNSSQTPSTINLPPEVFNLAQSYLSFQITLTAAGAGNFIWTYEDTLSAISHIQHYAQSNQYIADIDQLQNYLKIVMKKETSLPDFLSNDSTNGFYPSNVLNNAVPALRNSATGVANPSSVNYLEPAYFQAGASNTAVTKNVMFPLKLIKNSIFSIDKDLYYGQLSYLKLYFGPISKVAYQSTSNANPSAGTPAAYSGTGAIANLQLFLAIESNPLIREDIMNKVNNEGQKLYIPYVQAFKNSNAGTAQNIPIQFDIGSGQSLQKVIHSVFSNTESLDTAYDNSNDGLNGNAQKVQTYYTQINGRRLQDITLDTTVATALWTDYMSNKKMLWGSVLLNRNVYQFNWFHCDDFSEFGSKADQEGRPQLIAGLPMGPMPLVWTFVGVSMVNATYQHYDWAVFMKELRMSPSLVTVV